MQKFFAIAAILLSVVAAAPLAIPEAVKGIQPEGINKYGDDGNPSMVDINTGEIVPFETAGAPNQPVTVSSNA